MCRTARDEDGTAENKYRTLEAEYGTAEKSRRMEKKGFRNWIITKDF